MPDVVVAGSAVEGTSVVGSTVVGSSVIGSTVVGAAVVGSSVIGSVVVGSVTRVCCYRSYRCRDYRISFNPVNICFYIGVHSWQIRPGTTNSPGYYPSKFAIANKRTSTISLT